MDFKNDKRVVLTLDAGGTNFVFSAVRGGEQIVEPFKLPSNGDDLKKCLDNIVTGFKTVAAQCDDKPVALSFAFPGPADYLNGIIGKLENLPAFKGGVALGPMLEDIFEIPVFIRNDGDLFVYGEAIAGALPWVNEKLEKAGRSKRYKTLFGVTLGTGFGGGICMNNEMIMGDNSAAAEINLMRDYDLENSSIEEGTTIRGVKRFFAYSKGIMFDEAPEPHEIFNIGIDSAHPDNEHALLAFKKMGRVTAEAIANALTIVDGLVVIGGGLSGAYPLFLEELVKKMNEDYVCLDQRTLNRLPSKVYNLEKMDELNEFIKGNETDIVVPFSGRIIRHDPNKTTGVIISRLGTEKAVAIGAYAVALSMLGKD